MTEKFESFRKNINKPKKLYSTEKVKELDGEIDSKDSEPTIQRQTN